MRYLKRAAYLSAPKLVLTFDNDVTKVIDLAPHLAGEIFQPLRDPAYFAAFS